MNHLPHIARLAKSLRVLAQVPAAAHDWNDVIENKIIFVAAPRTGFCFPIASLSGRKVFSVAGTFSAEWFFKMREIGKHLVSIKKPSLLKSGGYFFSRFRRVSIALGWAGSLFIGIGSSAFANSGESCFVVGSTPKRIVFTQDSFATAFRCGARYSFGSEQICGVTIFKDAADNARDFASPALRPRFFAWNGIGHNGVKSVEPPLYDITRIRAIPSQAAQECAEGVTTRAWSPDRTVKPHERATRKGRDSLGYAVTHRSADKEPHDNNSDEVLNISPNSPISAAQFSITQYAAAISISGLEVLQNSSKEQIIDLMEGRIKIANAQLMNRIDYDLYQDGTGNGGKNLTGLAAAVPDTPTSGTYGGISRSANAFWQSQKYSGTTNGGAAVSAANIIPYMTSLALSQVRGSDKPDLFIGDSTYFGFYTNALQAIQRITSEMDAASGFANLAFNGGGMRAKVVLGSGVNYAVNTAGTTGGATAAHMWALNTNYLFFRPHRDRNFVPIGGERQSVNQDAIVKLIGWAGNLTCSNSSLQGVLVA